MGYYAQAQLFGPILIPYATVPFGAMGGYFGLAAAVLLISPLFFWLPDPPRNARANANTDKTLDSLSPLQRFAEVLGIAGFVGLSGGVVAAWLADRFGNLRPALIGIALNVVVASSLALWTSPVAFAVLYVCWNATFYFVVPYILGIMSEMDRKGRWAVATDAVWWMGAAPGPAIGGYVVASAGYPGLAGLTVALGILAMTIFRITLGRFYSN